MSSSFLMEMARTGVQLQLSRVVDFEVACEKPPSTQKKTVVYVWLATQRTLKVFALRFPFPQKSGVCARFHRTMDGVADAGAGEVLSFSCGLGACEILRAGQHRRDVSLTGRSTTKTPRATCCDQLRFVH